MEDMERLLEIEQEMYNIKKTKRKIAVVRNILAFNLLAYILVTLFYYIVVFNGKDGPIFMLIWIMFSSVLGIWSTVAMSTKIRELQSEEKLREYKKLHDEKLKVEYRIYNEKMKNKLKENSYGK